MSDDEPRPGPEPTAAERDAWLRAALRHAPDARAAPPPALSETILAEARATARSAGAARSARRSRRRRALASGRGWRRRRSRPAWRA